MEARLSDRSREWRRYGTEHALLRLSLLGFARVKFLRERRPSIFKALMWTGVGGIARGGGGAFVKCIHLQIASFLGLGRHPAEDWLRENVSPWECEKGSCKSIAEAGGQ
jgi:hypothetical protein